MSVLTSLEGLHSGGGIVKAGCLIDMFIHYTIVHAHLL